MFTGIVTDRGCITHIEEQAGGGRRIWIQTHYTLENVLLGASIACDGCCLTVTSKEDKAFIVDVSAETLSCTTLATWHVGTFINLEQALALGQRIEGHIVLGHVDDVGLVSLYEKKNHTDVTLGITYPKPLTPFFARKGSVAVNGVSLTINFCSEEQFLVNLIPHTCSMSTLGSLTLGQRVNLEVDPLSRYVEQHLRFIVLQK